MLIRSYDIDLSSDKALWVDPSQIEFSVRSPLKFSKESVIPGDWDLDGKPYNIHPKYVSVLQHFQQGLEWEDTLLFQRYKVRLQRGGSVRGCITLDALKENYQRTVDSLFDDMKKNGFRYPLNANGEPVPLPGIFIGRNGNYLFCDQGNHRLAIAKLLRLEKIACQPRARHPIWAKLRERIFRLAPDQPVTFLSKRLASHPDLADLVIEIG